MCAVLDEENQLTPRSNSISTWEKFKIYKINDSEYGIRSAENRKYVKADLDNGGKLIAGSDSIAEMCIRDRCVECRKGHSFY